jgi:Protein of unknown function (DUF1552)
MSRFSIERRRVLRSLGIGGASVALPPLAGMFDDHGVRYASASAAEATAPVRLMTFFSPNGAYMEGFTPTTAGADYVLPSCLEPFQKVKSKLLVLTGLKNEGALKGAGDSHEKGRICFATGLSTPSGQMSGGASIDQVAAQALGDKTALRSLVVAPGESQGSNSQFLSWAAAGQPVAPEVKPHALFDKLFGGGGSNTELENVRRKRRSILDFVAGDLGRLTPRLGLDDRRRLDAHLDAVRDLERRITLEEQNTAACKRPMAPPIDPTDDPWQWIYGGYPLERYRLLMDLAVMAAKCDLTRAFNLSLYNIDIVSWIKETFGDTRGHHDLSHDEKALKIQEGYTRYQMGFLAEFMEKLDAIPEGNGTVLDNAMIYAGSEISHGAAHNYTNMPVLLGGGGGGRIKTGQHVNLMKFLVPGKWNYVPESEWTDIGRLFLTMLKTFGVTDVNTWGTASTRLSIIEA